ncbi:MAG: glycerol kinase GlpK [Chloroflexota bacterium]
MATPDLVLALDQGTTSSRAIAFDRTGRAVASASREFEQRYPAPGHVTHDPEAIWASQLAVAREVVERAGGPARLAALGLTNQRETTVVWERDTGRAVADAIVWQSRITAPFCAALRDAGHEPLFRARTGLPLDAYFSGPKIRHILDADPGLRARAERGELAFGTVDSFLLWRLTGGRVHATDVSNASRTLLFDIHRLAWDDELLDLVGVPRAMLPEVRPSSGVFGETEQSLFGAPIPIGGVAGDQQAATFGQACFIPGAAKNTYGTGAFLLLNTGAVPIASEHGLLTTVLWQLGPDEPPAYALEGSVFVAGAAVQWLRDGLRAIGNSGEVERLAAGVDDTGGVYLVPAFVGLGAPHWDPHARGALLGLTRGTGLPQIARATIESIAYQVRDVLDAMDADAGSRLRALRVDGGAAVNDTLLQFQADILDVPVERPVVAETTALGAAYLAGLAVGFWRDPADVAANWALDRRFEPAMDPARRERLLRGWRRAVERSLCWAEPD